MNQEKPQSEWRGPSQPLRPTFCAACRDDPCRACPWLSLTPCSLSPGRGLSMCHQNSQPILFRPGLSIPCPCPVR
jgi:hypothetical protein